MIDKVIDPATQMSESCEICGEVCWNGCMCPECEECGTVGGPDCIVTHMSVAKWEKSLLNMKKKIKNDPSLLRELHPTIQIFIGQF